MAKIKILVHADVQAVAADVLRLREFAGTMAEPGEARALGRHRGEEGPGLDTVSFEEGRYQWSVVARSDVGATASTSLTFAVLAPTPPDAI